MVDFKAQLRKQLAFLKTSCELYDKGNRDEAIRIAVSLRVLFYDNPPGSTSLMSHLNSTQINLLSTCEIIPPGNKIWLNLVSIHVSPHLELFDAIPQLDNARTKQPVPLKKWWRREVIYIQNGTEICRLDIVKNAANKDGGAHVDSILPQAYAKIIDGMGWQLNIMPDNGPKKDINLRYANLAPLRQMAYEVLHSPDVMKLAL